MRIYWKIPDGLKLHYDKELFFYLQAVEIGHYQNAWRHLERAHILGQRYPYQHSEVHWIMLKFGFRIKNGKEILGQILRLLSGGIKSFVGIVPVGNTGGANVPPLKPMEIPTDLQELLEPFEK